MPIQLQNHRTSNAKLFSVGGGSNGGNKQKLHTAASLQAHRNNLKVRKNDSGSGFAMVSRMFTNPTNATPNLPDAIPDRNCRQKPGARRHSMTGGPGAAAAADVSSSVTSSSTQGPSSEQMSVSACTNSPRRRETVASTRDRRKDCSKSPMRRLMGSMTDASRGGTRSPMRRIVSLDYGTATPDDASSQHSRRSNNGKNSSSSSNKKNVRRSRSFGPMGVGNAPIIKNIGEAIGAPSPSSSSMDRSSMATSRRRSTLRRGSNDSGRSAQSAATAPGMRRPQSDPLLPLDDEDEDNNNNGYNIPPSPRNTLRAKREQMRRKSYGGGMAVEDEMASLALPISQQQTPRPPETIGNLLDDIAADDSDNDDDDDVSLDSFLSTSS